MSNDDGDKEVVVVAQVLLEEVIHPHFANAREFEASRNVTNLRREDAVDRPGDGRAPVVPPPPDGNHLLKIENYEFRDWCYV